MIRDIEDLDDTPLDALKKWRELSETARRLVVEELEKDKSNRLAKGLPTQPTARDRERLERGARALALGEPESPWEILQQLETLHQGIAALQSTDDLGSDAANRRAVRHMDTLIAKHDRLQKLAAAI
jgi:hypothetical protein